MIRGQATFAIARRSLAGIWSANALLLVVLALACVYNMIARTPMGTFFFLPAQPAWLAILSVWVADNALTRDQRERWLLLSAPLYGRELGRAVVIAPLTVAGSFALLSFPLSGMGAPLWQVALADIGAVTTGVFIAVSATLRSGKDALVFSASGLLAAFGLAYLGRLGPIPTAASVVLAAVGSYFALRAFGETLARLDLVD